MVQLLQSPAGGSHPHHLLDELKGFLPQSGCSPCSGHPRYILEPRNPLLTCTQVHDHMAASIKTLSMFHCKLCVFYTRLHQQGPSYHMLIHQKMVLHEGQGFVRGWARGALEEEGSRSVSWHFPFSSCMAAPLPPLLLPPSLALFPRGTSQFKVWVKLRPSAPGSLSD